MRSSGCSPTVIPSQVRSGEVIKASWHVAVPPDAHLGQAPITIQAVYTAGDQRGVTYGSVSVLGAYATLADAFNNAGISADADVTAADFDGTGASYSEQALTSVGFVVTPSTRPSLAILLISSTLAVSRKNLIVVYLFWGLATPIISFADFGFRYASAATRFSKNRMAAGC